MHTKRERYFHATVYIGARDLFYALSFPWYVSELIWRDPFLTFTQLNTLKNTNFSTKDAMILYYFIALYSTSVGYYYKGVKGDLDTDTTMLNNIKLRM